MKNKYIIFTVFVFIFLISNVSAITGSGSSGKRISIYPAGDKYCENSDTSGYYTGGGVFLKDSTESESKESDPIVSEEVYESKNLAQNACSNFSLENKDQEYLCKEYPETTAYACNGTIEALSGTSNEYLEKYITGGLMFATETDCLTNCTGTCSLKTGYSYKYVKTEKQTNSNGIIAEIGGRRFTTYDSGSGLDAFCVQPSKSFHCPQYYTSSKELIPQYCENDQLDLSTCGDDFYGDYKCGLAYIALKATGGGKTESDAVSNGTLSDDEYAAADMAMRMWAADKGQLSGMNAPTFRLTGGDTTSINFYGITALRVEEDANYLEYGLSCSKTSKNNGVMCDYNNYTLYRKAIELYNDALHVNENDEIVQKIVDSTNRVPKLITQTLSDNGNTVTVTNPTNKTCNIVDENCRVKITLYDVNGNEVPSDSQYCDKNYCYAKYTTENLCKDSEKNESTIKITIENFTIDSGLFKEYRHCTDPTNNQIMFSIEAKGHVDTTNVYIKTFSTKVSCECADDSGTLQSDTDSKKLCVNYNELNSSSEDYDGYEEGHVKDPSMSTILNSCSGEKYFRATEYETDSDTCKIYCRNEITFYMANKEKVYSGMQFRYELEEKITNNLNSDQHLTAIVLQQKQCVSEIDYDKWQTKYQSALVDVANAWNEWKKWDVLKYRQENVTNYPGQRTVELGCTANKDAYDKKDNAVFSSGTDAANKCVELGGDVKPSNSWPDGSVAYKYCDEINGLIRDYNDVDSVPSVDPNGNGLAQNSSEGICIPKCLTQFYWWGRRYHDFNYDTGSSTSPLPYSSWYEEGTIGVSNYSCNMVMYYELAGTNTISKYSKTELDGFSCDSRDTGYWCSSVNKISKDYYLMTSEPILITSDVTALSKTFITEMHNKYDQKYGDVILKDNNGNLIYESLFYFNTKNFYYDLENGPDSKCTDGVDGDIGYVIEQEEIARLAYNKAQAAVQKLLTTLQQCNMYGSGLETDSEPDIKYYALTKSSKPGSSEPTYPGSGSGDSGNTGADEISGGNEATKVGPGTEGSSPEPGTEGSSPEATKDASKYKNVSSDATEYSASSLESNVTDEYAVLEVTSTANSKSIKRKILSGASCIDDDSCVELDLKYDDVYGKDLTTYNKVTGIVKTDDLYNVYCDDTLEKCFRVASVTEDETKNGNWENVPNLEDNKTKSRRIVCDITADDPVDHFCEYVNTAIPDNNYVSFKVTTEVDFYRPKNYYVKAFTGEVVETKSTTMLKTNNYTSLGKNIYPVSNNAEAGLHSVEYTFSNLGISKFGSKAVDLDKYEYECSFEIYNNTTGYNCTVQYDSNGNPIPSACSNFCFYVEDTVPNLECIEWLNTDASKGYGFVFRNVELSNLFPSERSYGNNWTQAQEIIDEIQNAGDDVYLNSDHLELSVTLTTDSIKKIREYNRYKNTNSGGYLDNSLINCTLDTSIDGVNNRFSNCRSTFINELVSGSGTLGVGINSVTRRGSEAK